MILGSEFYIFENKSKGSVMSRNSCPKITYHRDECLISILTQKYLGFQISYAFNSPDELKFNEELGNN